MSCYINEAPSDLLVDYISLLSVLEMKQPILDLACGAGRNGLYLLNKGLSTVFSDRNEESLKYIEQQLESNQLVSDKDLSDKLGDKRVYQTWLVDLENPEFSGLEQHAYSAIIVFRYLHRELFDTIKAAILPGGLVIYETFNESQPEFGRPKNPNFLLKSGELAQIFSDWEILHSFDGVKVNNNNTRQGISQIVARKPKI